MLFIVLVGFFLIFVGVAVDLIDINYERPTLCVGQDRSEIVIEEVSLDCLENYADNYCNLFEAIEVNENSFRCLIKSHPRLKIDEVTQTFYFLDKEIEDCTLTKLYGGKNAS